MLWRTTASAPLTRPWTFACKGITGRLQRHYGEFAKALRGICKGITGLLQRHYGAFAVSNFGCVRKHAMTALKPTSVIQPKVSQPTNNLSWNLKNGRKSHFLTFFPAGFSWVALAVSGS